MQSAVKRYYNINKVLMSKIGVWPRQSKLMKILLPTVVTSFMFSVSFLEFVKMLETLGKLTELSECLIIFVITIGGYCKLFTVVLNNKSMERLLSLVDYHWCIFTHSLEVEVMHEYAIMARKMTITYAERARDTQIEVFINGTIMRFAVGIYSLMSCYILIPVTPRLLDLIKPLNESRPYAYLFEMDYSFQKDEHYYFVILHMYLTTILTMNVMVVVDTFYMMFAQHACSLFAAIGHRLENLTLEINWKEDKILTEDTEVVNADKSRLTDDHVRLDVDNKVYRELTFIVQKHQLIVEFISLLDTSFALYSLVLLFVSITILSLIGLQIIALLDRKMDMIRPVVLAIGAFMHLFVLNYPGQRIMDHSIDIFYKAYNMQWYKISRRSTQILSILLHRSIVPCTLTAGKVCVLSMENYASTVQMAMSYFTTFLSMK